MLTPCPKRRGQFLGSTSHFAGGNPFAHGDRKKADGHTDFAEVVFLPIGPHAKFPLLALMGRILWATDAGDGRLASA